MSGLVAMNAFWRHLVIAAAVIVGAAAVAKLIDRRIARRDLPAATITRYRVLRRTVFTAIVFIGVVSALLVIPEVRAVAGGVLASSAVIGLVIGFASQRTIGNAVAGILIAFTQPLRLGDRVEVGGTSGIVEEIGLTYTWVRTPNNDRLVIPNEKLASDTIRNSTIRSAESLAEVKVQVPLTTDLGAIVESLRQVSQDVLVTDLAGNATIVVRRWVAIDHDVEREASDLNLAVHARLREAGVFA